MDLALEIVGGCINVNFQNGDYVGDEGLATAVLISLFSEQRAAIEELPNGETRRGGYWGDTVPDVPGDRHGSRLWLLTRNKIVASEIPKIEGYAAQSLAWMIEDGVSNFISVVGSIVELASGKAFNLAITIQRPEDPRDSRFNVVWNGQEKVSITQEAA